MPQFAVVVVVEAKAAEEASRFVTNELGGIRWDQPLEAPFIGVACPVGHADCYETVEIHLLRDGMRSIAVPEPGA